MHRIGYGEVFVAGLAGQRLFYATSYEKVTKWKADKTSLPSNIFIILMSLPAAQVQLEEL